MDQWTIEREGVTFTVRTVMDDCMGAPWEEHDGHGPVREVRNVRDEKRPGEIVLGTFDRGRGGFLYDLAEAQRIARRDGWGAGERQPGETARQYAARAVAADIRHLRGWVRTDWWWLTMEVRAPWGDETHLGGIESSDERYVQICACELADELLARRKYDEREAWARLAGLHPMEARP